MTKETGAFESVRPPWFGPGPGDEGEPAGSRIELARIPRLALSIDDRRSFAEGIAFTLVLDRQAAWRPDPYDPKSWTHSFNRRLPRAGRLPVLFAPEVLRIGVRHPDGREAWNIDPGPWTLEPGEEPPGSVLVPLGGESKPFRFTQEYWVWPKPESALRVMCEWRAAGITTTEVDLPIA